MSALGCPTRAVSLCDGFLPSGPDSRILLSFESSSSFSFSCFLFACFLGLVYYLLHLSDSRSDSSFVLSCSVQSPVILTLPLVQLYYTHAIPYPEFPSFGSVCIEEAGV